MSICRQPNYGSFPPRQATKKGFAQELTDKYGDVIVVSPIVGWQSEGER
jgi:hypothetical protein